jgi:hypothetical protein
LRLAVGPDPDHERNGGPPSRSDARETPLRSRRRAPVQIGDRRLDSEDGKKRHCEDDEATGEDRDPATIHGMVKSDPTGVAYETSVSVRGVTDGSVKRTELPVRPQALYVAVTCPPPAEYVRETVPANRPETPPPAERVPTCTPTMVESATERRFVEPVIVALPSPVTLAVALALRVAVANGVALSVKS